MSRELPNDVEWKEVGAARRAFLAELRAAGWKCVPVEPKYISADEKRLWRAWVAAAPELED